MYFSKFKIYRTGLGFSKLLLPNADFLNSKCHLLFYFIYLISYKNKYIFYNSKVFNILTEEINFTYITFLFLFTYKNIKIV